MRSRTWTLQHPWAKRRSRPMGWTKKKRMLDRKEEKHGKILLNNKGKFVCPSLSISISLSIYISIYIIYIYIHISLSLSLALSPSPSVKTGAHSCPVLRPPVRSVPLGMVNDAAHHAERISVKRLPRSRLVCSLKYLSKWTHKCMLYIMHIILKNLETSFHDLYLVSFCLKRPRDQSRSSPICNDQFGNQLFVAT